MGEVRIPDHAVSTLEVLADLDGTSVDAVVELMLDAAIDARLRKVRTAYQALFGPTGGARPVGVVVDELHRGGPVEPVRAVIGGPISVNGHGPAPQVVHDVCDACDERHDPEDLDECAAPDDDPDADLDEQAAPSDPPARPRRKTAQTGKATCVRDGCDGKVKGRGMCTRHYNRWYTGKDRTAPDGTPSPAAPAEPSEPVEEPEVSDGDGARGTCQAARCPSDAPPGQDFCPTHVGILKRMTAKLRHEFGEDARDEASDRLVAGVR